MDGMSRINSEGRHQVRTMLECDSTVGARHIYNVSQGLCSGVAEGLFKILKKVTLP